MKNKLKMLTKKQEELVAGSILGDGCIPSDRKNTLVQSRTSKHLDLQKWQWLQFSSIGVGVLSLLTRKIQKIPYPYSYCQFSTKTNPVFIEWYNECYRNRLKYVSNFLLGKIGKWSLLQWYLDDGHYHYGNKRIGFATHGFSLVENKRLQEMLYRKYGVQSIIRHYDKYYWLELNPKNTSLFLTIILPLFPKSVKSVRYKLGHCWKGNSTRFTHAKIMNQKRCRRWYANNTEQAQRIGRESYYKHRQARLKCVREYRINNSELIRQKSKLYRKKHKEEISQRKKEYHQKNKVIISEKRKKYYQQNRDLFRRKGKEYYQRNRNAILARLSRKEMTHAESV